jgi:hypothetical protein
MQRTNEKPVVPQRGRHMESELPREGGIFEAIENEVA